jgi:hypothetical protein
MDQFAYAVGKVFCQIFIGATGAHVGRCCNVADMQHLGWFLVGSLALGLLSMRVVARFSR